MPELPCYGESVDRLRGRARELARIDDALAAGARLVTLLGPPGVGKTHLARSVVAGRDVRFIAAGEARNEAELVARVRRAFDVADLPDDAEALALLLDRFEALSPVLVLDGLASTIGSARELLADWLDAVPSLTVLVTSRERLDVPGETIVPIAPLELADAIELFIELVRRIEPDVAIDERDAARIVTRLDRLPLAIVLAAPRAARLGLVELARLLDDEARDGLPHASLARVFDGSWALLDDAARTALAACSVFRSPFTLEAARAVLAAACPERELATRAAELMSLLGDASLLGTRLSVEGARVEMLGVSRSYAGDRLQELGLRDATRAAHARFFAAGDERGGDDYRAWRLAELDHDDLAAAYTFAVAHEPALAVELALRRNDLLVRRGPAELQRAMLEDALTRATDAARSLDVSIALARHHGLRGNNGAALRTLEAAALVARELGDLERGAWIASLSAFCLRPLGRRDEARARGDEALAAARALGDARLEAMAEQVLGLVDLAEGNHGESIRRFRAAAAIARVCSAPRIEAISLANLADASLRAGVIDEAGASLREAQALFAAIDDRVHVAKCAVPEATLARLRGELDRAESVARSALDVAHEHGDGQLQIEVRAELAQIARARGDGRLARRFVEEAEALARRVEDVDLARMLETLRASLPDETRPETQLLVAPDGGSFTIGTVTVDLRRRGPLRRLLAALARERIDGADRALDVPAMLAAGWPGERMRAASGAARVYMAVRRLRGLGLERVLVTDEVGYRLDPGVPTRWTTKR